MGCSQIPHGGLVLAMARRSRSRWVVLRPALMWSRPHGVAPHSGPHAQRRAWQRDAAIGRSRGLGDPPRRAPGSQIHERDGAVVVGASVPEAVVAVGLCDERPGAFGTGSLFHVGLRLAVVATATAG